MKRFRFSFSGVRIKRELGVNPKQSRCCEAPLQHSETTYATDKSGRLQDGSESEDLPFVKGLFPRGLGDRYEKDYLFYFFGNEKMCPLCGGVFSYWGWKYAGLSACICKDIPVGRVHYGKYG